MHSRRCSLRLQSRKTHRGWTNGEGMQEPTSLARLFGGAALPLTLFPLRARAATAKTGRIDHPQASVSFPTPLMGTKRLPCWTAKRPIGLERKVLSREATRFPRRVAFAGGGVSRHPGRA